MLIFNLYLHKAANLSSTNGALVSLHSHNLWALNTQAHMSARQYNCILCGCIADNTLFLCLISDVCSCIINTENIIQVKDGIIVLNYKINHIYKEFLLKELKFQVARRLLGKLTISKLNCFLCSSCIVLWIYSLNSYHNWVIIIFYIKQVLQFVRWNINCADMRWELLL